MGNGLCLSLDASGSELRLLGLLSLRLRFASMLCGL